MVHQIFTQIIVRACSMFYPYEGYRSVIPLDVARVNRTLAKNKGGCSFGLFKYDSFVSFRAIGVIWGI